MSNKCPTMPEVTSTLHSPQLSQPTPSLGKCLPQLGSWDGWETAQKNREGGDRAVVTESEDFWETWMTDCGRLLSCQMLSLKASTKGCRLFSSEKKNSLGNASPLQFKTIIAVNKSFFFSVGDHVCAQSYSFNTYTNKLTVSSLSCVHKIGHVGKTFLPFRRRQSSKFCTGMKTHAWKEKSLYGCAEHLHLAI